MCMCLCARACVTATAQAGCSQGTQVRAVYGPWHGGRRRQGHPGPLLFLDVHRFAPLLSINSRIPARSLYIRVHNDLSPALDLDL